ncbi:molybdopterin oxidoreductase [Mycolicibacterium neoaurum]|uniref:molybdopterin-containing oxidoreductase family protein n=1 Tax=Mycolicibacterium neoaurum TaxID=1795 RepID=UPI00037B1B24|nr:molybdopterin-dependent oxidoreductase [Mycolicibacterium neoaurum]AHC24469.2 molybdopterin oxidoreductase [Mycolicibacterium neoaurum VKM Ac-1815D]AMO05058.1 molybdopterin oxidoreductase [Mycolicibacterium neoaurum]AXK76629.1 molybdopterin oxidoreductase [Mycolicibacterium neoaurum]KJQ52151.1 molybdopterin oxidoreductase [Mycolicibacterium neoaurum]KUM07780.1 molybdopterin oxidoreductase [Mycolicibacterium neoaurum]
MATTSHVRQEKTFCGICEASCGLVATVADGRLVELRPDPEHPASRGFACSKGVQFGKVVDDPDRVTVPLRRTSAGEFEAASWDEALDDIGARLRAIRDQHGTESIGVAWGNPIAWNYSATVVMNGLAAALKTKHHYTSASIDVNNYWAAADMMYGNSTVNPLPDFAASDFALIVGANPVISHGSLVTTGRIREVLRDIPRRGGRVVVVDPRRTETARLFEHVAIKPGADAWLLLAMLRVIFDEARHDVAILARQATGVEGLRRLAGKIDLRRAAAETGINVDTITELARALAAAPAASVYGRCGASLGPYSTLVKYLLDALAIVTGNFDRRGGMVLGDPMVDFETLGARFGIAGRGRWKTRVDGVPEVMGTAPLACLPREITTPGRGRLRALVAMSSNMVTSAPESSTTADALAQLDLMVSLDPYVTETSRLAHWILPPTLWLEREQLPVFTQAQSTVPNAQWVKPILPPRGQARDDWWILDQIARRIGIVPSVAPAARALGRLGFRPTPSTITDLVLRTGRHGDLFGLRRAGLNKAKLLAHQGAVKLADACPVGVLERKLHTHDRRIHLDVPELAAEVDRMVADTGQVSGFPLRLFSIRELRSHNSWLHNVPELMVGRRRCHAVIHPEDAHAAGVHDHDDIVVTSPWGQVRVPVRVSDDVAVGAVGMTHGWGHDGLWQTATAAGGSSYNLLTPNSADHIDRPSGNAFFNGVPVSVAAAEQTVS